MMDLSICIIAKNEENNIENCLKSIQEIADEIVVVDTGSVDQTINIAQKYKAKVIQTTWENDFSKARNIALEEATKEWILVLDCDECLRPIECEKVKALLNVSGATEAYHFKLFNYIGGRVTSSAIVLRLFRNREMYRFRGKIHEQIIHSIVQYAGVTSVQAVDITIDHYGYDEQIVSQKEKNERNLGLLLSYEEKDKDGYYYYSLGNEYARIKKWNKAALIYNKVLYQIRYSLEKPVYYAYLLMHLSSVYYELGFYDEVIKICDEAEKYLPYFKDMYFTKAITYRYIGELRLAQIYAQKYLECKETKFEYPSHQYQETDAKKILEELNQTALEPFLYTCVLIYKDTPILREGIKNIYNISKKVYGVILANQRIELRELIKELEHRQAKCICLEEEEINNLTVNLPPVIRDEWLLMLRDDEILPFGVLNLVYDLINKTDAKGYNLSISDWSTGEITKELRLVKVLEDGTISIPEDEVGESCLVIYKNYPM